MMCPLLPLLSLAPPYIFSTLTVLSASTYAGKKIILFDWKANIKRQLFLCKSGYSFSHVEWVWRGTDGCLCPYACMHTCTNPLPKQIQPYTPPLFHPHPPLSPRFNSSSTPFRRIKKKKLPCKDS